MSILPENWPRMGSFRGLRSSVYSPGLGFTVFELLAYGL